METALAFYGGGNADTVSGGGQLILRQTERWQHLVISGGSGNAILKLPKVGKDWHKGGPYWSITLQVGGTDIDIVDWDDNLIDVIDANGVTKSFIDVSDIASWGTVPAIRIFLEDPGDGGETPPVWRIIYWDLEP